MVLNGLIRDVRQDLARVPDGDGARAVVRADRDPGEQQRRLPARAVVDVVLEDIVGAGDVGLAHVDGVVPAEDLVYAGHRIPRPASRRVPGR